MRKQNINGVCDDGNRLVFITKRIYEKFCVTLAQQHIKASKIWTPRLENQFIFTTKTLTPSLTSEENVHQCEASLLQILNEKNFWRQFYEKVSRRHKVSNKWEWHIFQ